MSNINNNKYIISFMPISMTVGRRPRPAGPTCFLPTDSQHMPCLTSVKADNQLCFAIKYAHYASFQTINKSGPGFNPSLFIFCLENH